MGTVTLLDGEPVEAWLRRRGLASPDAHVDVRRLAGGVSSLVVRAECAGRTLVLKQALPRLLVEQVWTADTVRLLHEARALRVAHECTPSRVPAVLDLDEQQRVLAIECAPAGWTDWKSQLLQGIVDADVGPVLGATLASWHRATAGRIAELAEQLPAADASFDELRIDPFYRCTASRLPEVADRITQVEATLRTDPARALVHGDFSPKNVLVGANAQACWVVDFEVAHVGAVAFDPAFLLTHLALKSLHRPVDAPALHATAAGFCTAYQDGLGTVLAPDWTLVFAHVAVLILARVHGKSPASYLTPHARARADRLGRALLLHGVDSPAALWRRIDEQADRRGART